MKANPQPPKLPWRFFRWFCRPDYLEEIEGDLLERFEKNRHRTSTTSAKWIFTLEVIRLIRPGLLRSPESTHHLNHFGMLKNYFKTCMRNLLKYRVFTFINVFGLAVAMVVSLLIITMMADQWQMDRFHEKGDRIYRVITQMENSPKMNASCPVPVASELLNYPMVENATRLIRGVGGDVVYTKDEKSEVAEVRGFFADSAFFTVFDFVLKEGNRATALGSPNSIVLSSQTAYKLFNDQNPIGLTVHFFSLGLDHINVDLGTETGHESDPWGSFVVTGVVDESKNKSHIKFDALISSASLSRLQKEGKVPDLSTDWKNHSQCYSYFVLNSQSDKKAFQTALNEISAKEEWMGGRKLLAQSLSEVVLGDFVGNPLSLNLPIQIYYFLGFLAIVILLSAGLNYTNLSIARALTRAREIGVRKVNGATRVNLIGQFLVESVFIGMLALLLANGLLLLIKPALKNLWVMGLLDFDLSGNLSIYLLFVGFTVLVGILSGFYPALILSGFSPVKVLKGLNVSGKRRFGFRSVLNVIQFVFTFFFIVTSMLIVRQFHHLVDLDYGMHTGNVIHMPLQGNDYQLLMSEMEQVAGVESVSTCEMIPAMPNSHGRSILLPNDEKVKVEFQSIHPNLLKTLDLQLIAGHNLQYTDAHAVVVNAYTVEALGYENAQALIGQSIQISGEEVPFEIVGVIRDFKFQSPISGESTMPLVYWYHPDSYSFLNIRIASEDMRPVIKQIEASWAKVDPVHPMNYRIYDESLAMANFWVRDLASVVGFIAVLAIVISCLGLLGMAIYTTERRVKEMGIRKVLGAGMGGLAVLLGKSFVNRMLIAIGIAAPLSHFMNQLWIENIPNRIHQGWGVLCISSMLLLVLGFLTIGFQVLSVSRRNPVDSLKYE